MENYYYEKLTEEQRIFYQDLCEGLRHRADKVPAPPGLKRNAFLTAIDAVVVEGYALEPGKKDYGGHALDIRWPLLLVTEEDPKPGKCFGYLMELIPDGYHEMSDFLRKDDDPDRVRFCTYNALLLAGMHLASRMQALHLRGWSYKDLDPNDLCIHPETGDEEARRAVRGFVKDSEQIISRIVTATVKTIRGIPQAAAEQDDAPSPAPDAFAYPAGTDAPEFPGGSVLSL